MAITAHFNHKTIRRLVVAFATLFNGYQVEKPDGTLIEVPILWSSKQKWYTKIKEDLVPSTKTATAITLPRMGFVISNINYDFNRKISSLNKISALDSTNENKLRRIYSPVPYTIDIDLFIASRTIDEGLQLVEQIVPFFTPSFNITIIELDELQIERDIPIKLNSVTPDFKTEGSFDGDDIKLWDLSFSLEVNLYKNITSKNIIKKVVIDTYTNTDISTEPAKLRIKETVDPETAYITDEFQILEEISFEDYETPKFVIPD
jgi:hypothetical protein